MKIAVIGAGPSGLCVAKELAEKNHEVTVFEASNKVGGVYTRSYKGLQLVNNNLMVAFSSYFEGLSPDDLTMWSAERYVNYLTDYAKKFCVLSSIRFNTKVLNVVSKGSSWELRVQGPEGEEILPFDYVVVCTGVHSAPEPLSLPNSSRFKGVIIHGNDVHDPEVFRGKRVVLVGSGEYASDLAYLIGRVAESLRVSVRRWTGFMIPRYQNNLPTDIDTSRIYHSLPKNLHQSVLRWLIKWKNKLEFGLLQSEKDKKIQAKANELNAGCPALGAFQRTSSKSENLIRALLELGVSISPEITDLQGNKVKFQDGSECDCDVIIHCNGFRPEFPFLDERLRNQVKKFRDMAYYMLPLQERNMAFVGFIRAGIGSIPPMAEMQSRYLALLLSGDVAIPGYEKMKKQVEIQNSEDFRQFPFDAGRLSGLTDYYRFLTTMSRLIGCEPPMLRLLTRSPLLFFKVHCAFICPAQFRLYGPGSDFKKASELIKNLPTVRFRLLGVLLLLHFLSLPYRKWQLKLGSKL